MFPEGMQIEIIEQQGKRGSAEVYESLIRYIDEQISKLILGQTMTSDSGSSLSQAQVHNEIRLELKRADDSALANTVNRDLIPIFMQINFGVQDSYPKIRMQVSEPEDLKAHAETIKILGEMGLPLSKQELYQKYGLSEPETDEDNLSFVEKKEPKEQEPEAKETLSRKKDLMTEFEDDHFSEWESDEVLRQPFEETVEELIKQGKSLEDLQEILKENLLDLNGFEEKLATASFAARALGDTRD